MVKILHILGFVKHADIYFDLGNFDLLKKFSNKKLGDFNLVCFLCFLFI